MDICWQCEKKIDNDFEYLPHSFGDEPKVNTIFCKSCAKKIKFGSKKMRNK